MSIRSKSPVATARRRTSSTDRSSAFLDGGEFAWNILCDANEAEKWATAAEKIDPENPRSVHLRTLLNAKRQRDRQHLADAEALRNAYAAMPDGATDVPSIPQPDELSPVGNGKPTPPALHSTPGN